MIHVRIELWPGGDRERASFLGAMNIANDGSGDLSIGNYDVAACHAGIYAGKRREPYKTGRVTGFPRRLSPYRLLYRALKAIGET